MHFHERIMQKPTRTKRTTSAYRRGIAMAAGGFALAATPSVVQAQSAWQIEGGAFLSYHFGGGLPGRIGLSLEMRQLHARRTYWCDDNSPAGSYGMVQRIAVLGWNELRLTVGVRAGMESRAVGAGGEVAAGYRLLREPGALLHLGVEGAVANAAFARLAYVPGGDGSVGLGAGFPSQPGAVSCGVPGRPLRRGEVRAPLPRAVFVAGDRTHPEPDSGEGRAARIWAGRASAEWASVPAFLELAEHLAVNGAPRGLVERACSAAMEESRHAVLSATIASALGGSGLEIVPSALAPRPVVTGRAGLQRLAVESFQDGCIGEEAAAAWATAEAAEATSPFVRMAQGSIATDEAGHAALAWDVIAWTLARGGAPVRAALVDAAEQVTRVEASTIGTEDVSQDGLAGLGCLSAGVRVEILVRHEHAAKRRLRAII